MSETNMATTAATAATTAPATRGIYAALAKAQLAFGKITKNQTAKAGSYSYAYADLATILSTVTDALNKEGVFLSQDVTSSGNDVHCRTILYYVDGSTIVSGEIAIPACGGNNAAQARGSAITYARRYSLCATLGIAADDDDDGKAAGGDQPATPTAPACPAALKARAEEAAKHGISAYESFFREIEKGERLALSQSGLHAAFKALAMRNTK